MDIRTIDLYAKLDACQIRFFRECVRYVGIFFSIFVFDRLCLAHTRACEINLIKFSGFLKKSVAKNYYE